MRKTVPANSIEQVRRKFTESMLDKELFDMDTSIFKKTEEKKTSCLKNIGKTDPSQAAEYQRSKGVLATQRTRMTYRKQAKQ